MGGIQWDDTVEEESEKYNPLSGGYHLGGYHCQRSHRVSRLNLEVASLNQTTFNKMNK